MNNNPVQRRTVHPVAWRPPLDKSVNPYISDLRLVRHVEYGRLQAALNVIDSSHVCRVLEIGCWAGYFLNSLVRHFPEVWGVDDDSASVVEILPQYFTVLQIARELCRNEIGSVPYLVKATGAGLPFTDGYFDLVFCMDTLTHVTESEGPDVVNELRRVTRFHGQIIFSLPIEIGPIMWVKRLTRTLTGKQIDRSSSTYDFRNDLALLRKTFPICRTTFFPVDRASILNPFAIVSCRTA